MCFVCYYLRVNMVNEKINLKLECKKESIVEEISIDIVLDKLGLWKNDLKRILLMNKSEILSISIIHKRNSMSNNGTYINTEEFLFLEKM